MYRILPLLLCLVAFCAGSQAQTAPPQLEVSPLAKDCYVHTSYKLLASQPYPSNGLVVVGDTAVVLIDTPWDSLQSEQLVQWVAKEIKKPIHACLITHGHEDRTGGYAVMQRHGILLISSRETAALSAAEGRPLQGRTFAQDTTLVVGALRTEMHYPGKGHSPDNRVVWLPAQQVLFGGCLVKSVQATSLGNTADADLDAWPTSIRQLYSRYGQARYVVPGHQQWGDLQLLMHTLELLKKSKIKE